MWVHRETIGQGFRKAIMQTASAKFTGSINNGNLPQEPSFSLPAATEGGIQKLATSLFLCFLQLYSVC